MPRTAGHDLLIDPRSGQPQSQAQSKARRSRSAAAGRDSMKRRVRHHRSRVITACAAADDTRSGSRERRPRDAAGPRLSVASVSETGEEADGRQSRRAADRGATAVPLLNDHRALRTRICWPLDRSNRRHEPPPSECLAESIKTASRNRSKPSRFRQDQRRRTVFVAADRATNMVHQRPAGAAGRARRAGSTAPRTRHSA